MMDRYIEENETVLYRVKKRFSPIFFMIIFFPIWLYFGSIFMIPAFKAFVLKEPAIIDSEYYISGLIALLVFLPVALIIFLSYTLNRVVITDNRIYIRKGLPGKLQILNHSDIRSYQHVISRGRNNTNHSILFYLSCGKRVRTGELYMTLGSLQELLELLRGKFEGRGFTKQELKEMSLQNSDSCGIITRRNYFALLILLAPVILAAAMTVLYLLGSRI